MKLASTLTSSPNAERWCWLATGWSGPSKSDGDLALRVYSNGDWYNNNCSYSGGIRPALKVPSILFEDSEAGLDLSKIPTDDLLQEIHRRLETLIYGNCKTAMQSSLLLDCLQT